MIGNISTFINACITCYYYLHVMATFVCVCTCVLQNEKLQQTLIPAPFLFLK